MTDSYQRTIDYMRVSITDRCNLRCRYCMPDDQPFVAHEKILRYEEILRVCALAARAGVRTIKVTGGEPLVRRGCDGLLADLKRLPGIEHVTITTNGVLLGDFLERFREIGIDGVNISLDTLRPEVYAKITGRDEFGRVWGALAKALELGLRVKLNCVPQRGCNVDELPEIAALGERYPIDIRFIELMPIGFGQGLAPVRGEEVLGMLRRRYPDLREDPKKRGFGPARYYVSGRLKGGIGFIDAVSHSFCEGCNRVRLTSEGFLKLCLYHEKGVDLRAMLRGGADDAQILAALEAAIQKKPERHDFHSGAAPEDGRIMSQIGG